MFSLRRPSAAAIDRFLAESRELPLSYEPIGLAKSGGRGFRVDELVSAVGSGAAGFERAVDAIGDWGHFDFGWIEVFPKHAPIDAGTTVAVLARHLGSWSLNGCRVVYEIAGDCTFGFAYGTLTNHAESGEEIFQVSFDPVTRTVSYTIRAASRPRVLLARLGGPVARALQARFRRDSAAALRRRVSSRGPLT
jgi:uncharacterized protein (UPF0548 family)